MLTQQNVTIANSDNLKQFLYLFLIDIVKLKDNPKKTYSKYSKKDQENSEEGYGETWLKAYIYAFSSERSGKLTHERIKNIHGVATKHMQNPTTSGNYKKNSNYFAVHPEVEGGEANVSYSMTKEGLKEFIKRSLLNTGSVHSITFEKQGIILQGKNKKLELIKIVNYVPSISLLDIDNDKDFDKIWKLTGNKHDRCIISSMPHVPTQQIPDKVKILLQDIFDSFHREISKAHSDDAKIRVIVAHVQRITQLHPFLDGNIRTCYILLNVLLRDYGLPITILLNPNRLDCCDIDSLVSLVKQGQIIYQQFLNNHGTFTIQPSENLPALKSIQLDPEKMSDISTETLDKFVNVVIYASQMMNGLHERAKNNNQYATVMDALQTGEFNLALRRASHANFYDAIRLLLAHAKDLKLDVNDPSKNGNRALDWLLENKESSVEKEEIIQLLKSKGALTKNEVEKSEQIKSSNKEQITGSVADSGLFKSNQEDYAKKLLADMESMLEKNTSHYPQTKISDIQKNILPAIKNNDFGLALRKACAGGLLEVVILIMKYKDTLPHFNINEPSKANGKTALNWAYENGNSKDHAEIIKILEANGAKKQADLKLASSPNPNINF